MLGGMVCYQIKFLQPVQLAIMSRDSHRILAWGEGGGRDQVHAGGGGGGGGVFSVIF